MRVSVKNMFYVYIHLLRNALCFPVIVAGCSYLFPVEVLCSSYCSSVFRCIEFRRSCNYPQSTIFSPVPECSGLAGGEPRSSANDYPLIMAVNLFSSYFACCNISKGSRLRYSRLLDVCSYTKHYLSISIF
jgi:hypothetical protein